MRPGVPSEWPASTPSRTGCEHAISFPVWDHLYRGRGERDGSLFRSLCLVPKLVHLIERGGVERAALGRKGALDIGKAAFEFRIGTAQCHLRIDLDVASEIDQRKEQIASLCSEFVCV